MHIHTSKTWLSVTVSVTAGCTHTRSLRGIREATVSLHRRVPSQTKVVETGEYGTGWRTCVGTGETVSLHRRVPPQTKVDASLKDTICLGRESSEGAWNLAGSWTWTCPTRAYVCIHIHLGMSVSSRVQCLWVWRVCVQWMSCCNPCPSTHRLEASSFVSCACARTACSQTLRGSRQRSTEGHEGKPCL